MSKLAIVAIALLPEAIAACVSDLISFQRDGSLVVRRIGAMPTDGWQFQGDAVRFP